MATSRHLWVGGLPEGMKEEDIKDRFTRYGKVESVKLLPQKHGSMGLAAFVDFYDIEAAKEAHMDEIKINGSEVRTNYKSIRPETKEGKEHSRRYYNSPDMRNDSSNSSSSDSSSCSGSSDSSSDSDSDSSKKYATILKITNLPRRSDKELLGSLYSEYSPYSSRVVVKVFSDGDSKYSFVKFKRVEDCTKALNDSKGLSIFGSMISVSPYYKEMPSGGHEYSKGTGRNDYEEIDSNATRSLFVGNIPKNISIYELRDIFHRYGPILDVEIKKMSGNATYGFVLYYDLHCAITAKKFMDGKVISGNKIRVGYGKGTPSKVLWVDCIDSSVSEQQLEKQFAKYGRVTKFGYDQYGGTALVQYDSVDEAKEALGRIKGSTIGSSKRRIMADFANKDAKAAFFARLERLEGPTGPRPFHPSGPMYPMDGMAPHMMMGPMIPLDYYRPYPYMDDYYGGGYHRPRPPPPLRPPFEPRGFGDYEDELRAFGRRRERERRIEKEEERRKRHRANSSGDSSDSSRTQRRRRRMIRSSSTDNSRRDTKGNSSDELSTKGSTRMRNTRKYHEHREKQRNNLTKNKNDEQQEKKSPSTPESAKEDRGKEEMKDVKISDDDLSEECEHNITEKEEKSKDKKESLKPKVVISYEDEDEQLHDKPCRKTDDPVVQAVKKNSSIEQKAPSKVEIEEVPKPPEEEVAPRPPSPPPTETLILATERPKISIAWKERDKPQLQQVENNTRMESDLSSGDDFDHMDEDDETPEEKLCEKLDTDSKDDNTSVGNHREVILSHSSETGSEGGDKRGNNKNRPSSHDTKRSGEVKSYDDRHWQRYDDKTRTRNQDLRGPPENRFHSRFQEHKRYGRSPLPRGRVTPPLRSRSSPRRSRSPFRRSRSPLRRSRSPPQRSRSPPQRSRSPPRRSRSPLRRSRSPLRRSRSPLRRSRSPLRRSRSPRRSPLSPRNRPRTPIQRPVRQRQHGSPQREVFRSRHGHSPPYIRRREVKSDMRDRRELVRERSPRRIVERSRVDSSSGRHQNSPVRHSSFRLHRTSSQTPSPVRHSSRTRHRKEESRSDVVPSRPRTPSGSPPPLPPEEPGPVTEDFSSTHHHTEILKEEPTHTDVHDLLRRYPVMWQGHFGLKSELVAVQLHYLSGNSRLVELCLPISNEGKTPTIRISQRMKMEQSQLDGVENRIKNVDEHCLLLAFPCGRDSNDVQTQAAMLSNTIINYLLQKQAAGIVNIQKNEGSFVLHIFPPCAFSSSHLTQAASDLLSSTSDQCHLMIIIATNNN